jgi:hypothetical protein
VFSYLRVDSHSTWEQRRNSPTECNRVQKSAMGKEAETDTESQAGVAVARSESVAVVAVHWRQLGGGFPPQTLNGEEGEDSYLIGRILASFRAGGTELLDRPKLFSHVHLRRAADPELGCGPSRGAAPRWIRAQSQVISGEVSASNSGRGLRSRPGGCVPVVLVA